MWHSHTMERCSASGRNEILVLATTQMNAEDITQSERSQTQKDKLCDIPLPWYLEQSDSQTERGTDGGKGRLEEE